MIGGVPVAGVRDAAATSGEATIIEVTTQSSPYGCREFIGGLIDGGSLTINGLYDFADPGQAAMFGGVGGAVETQVVFSDLSGASFAGKIQSFGDSEPLDDCATYAASIKVAGPVTVGAYASLTVGTGDSAITYIARAIGTGGNAVSVTHASAAATHLTEVAAASSDVNVTPGTKARMIISGTTPSVDTEVFYTADYSSIGAGYLFTSDGINVRLSGSLRTTLYYTGTTWYLIHRNISGTVDYEANKISANTTPEGLTGWTVTTGSGSPTIAAAASNANQVCAAIIATPTVLALLTGFPGGKGTGAVGTASHTHLSGGA